MPSVKLFGGKTVRKAAPVKKVRKKRSGIKTAGVIIGALLILETLYFTAVYSNIPFIEKWRTIYIETAMSTFKHQWLATAFIPQDVIDKALEDKRLSSERQQGIESSWDIQNATVVNPTVSVSNPGSQVGASSILSDEQAAFFELFWELDTDSMIEYTRKNQGVLDSGWMGIKINEAGLSAGGTDIYTTDGEQVLAIDAKNKILILRVKGDGYRGALAKVKDPSMLSVAHASTLGESGQFAERIARDNGAILAMNASGFEDVAGVGNGGIVGGLSVASGVTAGEPALGNYKRMEIRSDDRMYIVSSYAELNSDTRDAVEFLPALIVDGQSYVSGTAGWGIQPRTVIAQSDKLEYLLLVVEGREVLDGIIGITLGECVDILLRHNAVQALNLDGGSSSILVYEGESITRSSNASKTVEGRTLPNAFVVVPNTH